MSYLKFNGHTQHNPECDILEYHYNDDYFITYGIYVNGNKKGEEFCEYYRGKNYNVNSKLRSYSRIYRPGNIPTNYIKKFSELRILYNKIYSK